MNFSKLTPYLVVLVAGIAIGALLRGCDCHNPLSPAPTVSTRVVPRPDSTRIVDSTRPPLFSVKGKPNRFVPSASLPADSTQGLLPPDSLHAHSDSLECLDTVGYFGIADSSALAPDTLSLCRNVLTNEFNVLLLPALRRRETIVHFVTHDTTTTIHEAPSWWDIKSGAGIGLIGMLVGAVVVLLLHK